MIMADKTIEQVKMVDKNGDTEVNGSNTLY